MDISRLRLLTRGMKERMPLFEFKCKDNKCGHSFEKLTKYSESEVVPSCPDCKGKNVVKMISKTSFSLKGGGWAADGYGRQ